MANPERTRDIWYPLDNAAIIFPAVSGQDNTNVFRLSCILREPVDPEILQRSLDTALTAFPYFQVVMRRGLFWFYLERTNIRPRVKLETGRPCGRIFYKRVKDLLFHVSYFQNRINLEVFHAIADGAGSLDLLRSIVYHYLITRHRGELPETIPPLDREPPPAQQSKDKFRHFYQPSKTKSPFKSRAYTIGGTLLPTGTIRIISATMSTRALLDLAKSRGATITAYLAALMICAVHQELMPRRHLGRTISVTVPVDLRGLYGTESSRNFFTVVDVGYNFSREEDNFDAVLGSVSRQLGEKLTPRALDGRLSYNMAVQRNILTRFTPLVLKNWVLRAAYNKAESATTCALSNMGRITMPEFLGGYIDHFSCLLNPTHLHRWKACVCSTGDKFVINFSSSIAETAAHKYLIRHLSAAGLDICISSNGVIDDEIL